MNGEFRRPRPRKVSAWPIIGLLTTIAAGAAAPAFAGQDARTPARSSELSSIALHSSAQRVEGVGTILGFIHDEFGLEAGASTTCEIRFELRSVIQSSGIDEGARCGSLSDIFIHALAS